MIKIRSLTFEDIEGSAEIQSWLNQFLSEHRPIATNLLMRLNFVSSDIYTTWIKKQIEALSAHKLGLYVARKLDDSEPLWNEDGALQSRPATGLGSEDLVYSIIANCCKHKNELLFDHPCLGLLKEEKIHHIVIIDDSIGSGSRVAGFIKKFMAHKSLVSWSSYGKIQFHIIAFARMLESTQKILEAIPGSDHGKRTFPKKSKIKIRSHLEYKKNDVASRWGKSAHEILSFCRSYKVIPSNRQLGFGRCMANIIFWHSVPNNIPGCLWFATKGFNPLFPQRSIPAWALELLGNPAPNRPPKVFSPIGDCIDSTLINVLEQIKKGVKNKNSLALRLGFEPMVVEKYLEAANQSGFINGASRLTPAGKDLLMKQMPQADAPDWSLYIPQSWCADSQTI